MVSSVTESVGSKSAQDGVFMNMLTDSRTAVITEGDLLELDSDGYVKKCTAALSVKFIGVAAATVAATTAASQKRINVQVGGKVRVRAIYDIGGTYTDAIVPGERVCVAEDNASNYDGQVMAHAPTSGGSDPNTNSKCVGIALTGLGSAAATPQNIDILLQIRCG